MVNWVKDRKVQNMLVTESEICKLMKELSAGKAGGYDGIDTEHWMTNAGNSNH